jgi:hypothetical protein
LIDGLLKCLPEARGSFYARGFELPRQYLAVIESMRVRASDEYDYQYYLDQVLREYLALRYPWQPSIRESMQPDERSSYLDLLASRASLLRTPAASLDPNFDLFADLDGERRMELLTKFRGEKQLEADRWAADVGERSASGDLALIDGIVRIAERLGYRPRRAARTRDEAIEFQGTSSQYARASLVLPDLRSLLKRGHVVVQYFFSDFGSTKPFGLDVFVPGGHLYSEWNKTPGAVLFAFYVQCLFLADLAGAMSLQSEV